MLLRKSKNWFDNLPYELRSPTYNALVKRSNALFRELDKNGAYDEEGNFIAEEDYYNDMYYELKQIDKLITELRKLQF